MNEMLRVALFLFCLFANCFTAFCQNPGNIGVPNLTAWFKPDALPLGNVISWSTTLSSIGGVTVTDAGAPYPQATNTPVNNVSNYNTTIAFINNMPANLQSLENSGSLNLLQNNTVGAQGTFFCAYYFPQVAGSNNNHMLLYNNTPHAIQFRNLGAMGRLALGLSPTNSDNATRNWTESFTPTIISYKGNRSTPVSFTALKNDLLFNVSSPSQSSGPPGLYIGNFPGNAIAPFNGYLHEYIFYDRDLTGVEMRKVNSYLAIKYGITLENLTFSAQGDYLATDGTTIWDASVFPLYHNNVIGIGRDDTQSLLQKQSHAFNDNYRLYVSNLEATNAANSGIFNADISYITMGQIIANACGTAASNGEAPAGLQSRLAKEWKITNTNFTQTFNLDVRIDTCQTPGSFVGNVDMANLRLLVDSDDGNFSNAVAYDQSSGISFTYTNGYITVSGINNTLIPNNSTRYITLAYNRPIVYFSGNNAICAGDSSAITLNILAANGPIDIDYSDGTTTSTLTNVVNGDVFYLSPNATTSYTVFGSVNFMDCCGSVTDSVFILSVNPSPNVVANASAPVICLGDSTQLFGSGANTYVWNNGGFNGGFSSPVSTTTYQVIGSNIFGCVDTNEITVTVNPMPSVSASADNDFFCIGEMLTLTGSGASTYIWSGGAIDNVAFAPNTTFTYLVTGTNNFNCIDTASITITVFQLPLVQANATHFGVCIGESAALSGTGTAIVYNWDNGVTNSVLFSPTNTATYMVTGTDVNGCQNTDNLTIVVFPEEEFYLGADTTICPQDGIVLVANQPFANYQWNTGATLPSLNVSTDGTFSLTVTDNNGCSYTDNQTITLGADCFQTLYIPNAFTPNGDEFNSYLRTTGDNIDKFEITIFNRWGEIMFISKDINQHWDGTFNGVICPDGVYSYTVTYTTNSGNDDKLRLTGSVSILR